MTGQQDQNSTDPQIQKSLNRQQADNCVVEALEFARKKMIHQHDSQRRSDQLPQSRADRKGDRGIQTNRFRNLCDAGGK